MDLICWSIKLVGFRGEYQSPARTATHVHQGARGQSGPPRLAFPNPAGTGAERYSYGCMTGKPSSLGTDKLPLTRYFRTLHHGYYCKRPGYWHRFQGPADRGQPVWFLRRCTLQPCGARCRSWSTSIGDGKVVKESGKPAIQANSGLRR